MSIREEDREISWYLQESLNEKTIFDAAGINDNVRLAGDGKVAVATQTKVHIFCPQGKHQHFFSVEWLILKSQSAINLESDNVCTTPLEWIRQKTCSTPTWIKDIQWLRCTCEGLVTWNLCVLFNDGDLLLLRSQASLTDTATSVPQVPSCSQEKAIIWQYKSSSFCDLYGEVGCISSVCKKSTNILFSVHQDTVIGWSFSDNMEALLTISSKQLITAPSYLLQLTNIAHLACFWSEKDDTTNILFCAPQNQAWLFAITGLPNKPSNISSRPSTNFHFQLIKTISFDGYLIALHCDSDDGFFSLVSSGAILRGNMQDGSSSIQSFSHPNAVDITGLVHHQFADHIESDATQSQGFQSFALTSTQSGQLQLLRFNGTNQEQTCIRTWTSSRAVLGIHGVTEDKISSLLFLTYTLPSHLDNSRDVQLRADIGRPMVVLRALGSHQLDVSKAWLFDWSERSRLVYHLVYHMEQYPDRSCVYALLRVVLIMQDSTIVKKLSNEQLPFPNSVFDSLHILQNFKDEPLEPQSQQEYIDFLNDRRMLFYANSNEVDEDEDDVGATNAANVDNSDSEAEDAPTTPSAANNALKGTPQSIASRSYTSNSTKKMRAGVRKNENMPGFVLTHLYNTMKEHLPPNPLRFTHLILRLLTSSVELLSMFGSHKGNLLNKEEFREHLQVNSNCQQFIQKHFTAEVAKTNVFPSYLFALDNFHGYSGLSTLVETGVLHQLRFRLRLLSLLHLWIEGLMRVIQSEDDPLLSDYKGLSSTIRLRILQIRCILQIHRAMVRSCPLPDGAFVPFVQRILSCSNSNHSSSVAASTISISPLCLDVLQYLSGISNESRDSVNCSAEVCEICSTTLVDGNVHHDPSRLLSSYCAHCELHIDRCCFTFTLLTSSPNSCFTSSSSTQRQVKLLTCTLCHAATRSDLIQSSSRWWQQQQQQDYQETEIDDTEENTASNIFCPFCRVALQLV